MKQATWKPSGEHVVKKREVAGFTVSEAIYPAGLTQPSHAHELASFSLVLAGSYLEQHGRREQARRAATVVFHPPRESHAVAFHSEVRILGVRIDPRRLAYLRERSVAVDSSASCRSATVAQLGRRMRREFRRADDASALSVEGLILEVLAEASRGAAETGERKTPRWLERAREFLRDNFCEPLAYEAVARAAGVHPVHLARVFREREGCTVGEYVRRLRVEFARRRIAETRTALSEIAHAAGFADHSHLTRAFKKQFGLTPSQYRNLADNR
jgi:AraC family transcriptional regulator